MMAQATGDDGGLGQVLRVLTHLPVVVDADLQLFGAPIDTHETNCYRLADPRKFIKYRYRTSKLSRGPMENIH